MIALIDYDSGNLRSAQKALLKVGAEVRVVRRPEEIDGARAALRKQELLGAVRKFIKTGRPFLGICVGYQALFERSEEFNSCAAGLEIFPGKVVRFSDKTGVKIPQIGWNQLNMARPD